MNPQTETNLTGIAIIGLSGRFPGADNVETFWQNLIAGRESISFFTDEELTAAGYNPHEVRQDPTCVAARGIVNNPEWFDAAFFKLGAKEAEITDPQHRLFLEASWEALENAGYDPAGIGAYVGVYAGASTSSYSGNILASRPDVVNLVGKLAVLVGNEKDFLATRVAYKLNLKGPAMTVNTACSSSLVAVCQACQALLGYQCDLALAGGVSVSFPQKQVSYHLEGSMISPDGRCRPFDAQAAGTVFSDGLGVVVLKRLAEAVNDGDQIYAVIKGFGLNNDGSAKVGFTAPSVEGQAEVIALALAQADFDPGTISYVEAHGTATPLGDPIEIAALSRAFRARTSKTNFCAIGSVKSNLGHLNSAAGIAGLIKTALALKHRMLPPSLHFSQPNPKIDFAQSPFFMNANLAEWPAGSTPRRAGVSAFGFGGTNAHVVLEESPRLRPSGPSRDWQLLLLSAKSSAALDAATDNLVAHFKANPELTLADAAFTLQVGRSFLPHRRVLVCRDVTDAIAALESLDARRVFTGSPDATVRRVAFMFPGQGAQYVNMGSELYRAEPVFKAEVDRCAEFLRPHLDLDLRQVLFPSAEGISAAEELLLQTRITQPALFVFEYALAKLWMSWGVVPAAMIGHSVGEYVAACLAGVFTLEDALKIVAHRARLVQNQPKGAMLAVRLAEGEVLPLLTENLSLAAVNAPKLCVVSGPFEAVGDLEKTLKAQGVAGRRLHTSHAFHSAMMEPVLGPLAEMLAGIRLHPPAIPYLSNVTGRWIAGHEATDPKYWADHVRQTVRFADGVGELLQKSDYILLEVGPGQTLAPLANQHPAKVSGQMVLSSFSAAKEQEVASLLGALGRLWLAGQTVEWSGFYAREKRRRVALPTYPFEKKRFWVEPARPADTRVAPQDMVQNSSAVVTQEPMSGEIMRNTKDANTVSARRQHLLTSLAALFRELSGAAIKEADASVTFMEMGFDSLLLLQASQAVAKRFSVRVSLRQLLGEFNTLDQLAVFLDQQMPPEALAATAPALVSAPASLEALQAQLLELTRQMESLRQAQSAQSSGDQLGGAAQSPNHAATGEPQSRRPVSTPVLAPSAAGGEHRQMVTLPLSEPQMEVWLAAIADREASCAYNQTLLIHLRRPLNLPALCASLQELVHRHDALRTTFLPDGSGQQIHPSFNLEVPLRDFSTMDAAEAERRLSEAIKLDDATPFDLAQGPLLRAQVFTLAATRHVLVLTAHHLVLDGWSIGVLLREFGQLYASAIQGVPASLPPALQYRDYLEWQNLPGNRARSHEAEAYWRRQYASLPEVVNLPSDRPRPAVKTYRADSRDLILDSTLYALVKQGAAANGCTLFTYLLASLNVLLHRLTGQGDLVVGCPAAGQVAVDDHQVAGSRSLVGHCVNFLPLRSQCDGNASFTDYVKTVRGQVLDAYDHQACTLGSWLKKLNLSRDSGDTALTRLSFNLSRLAHSLRLPEADFAMPPKGFNFFDLSIEAADWGETLRINARFNTDLFEAGTIERWLGHWKCLLEGAAANPEQRIGELPLLTAAERHQLLVEWNHSTKEFPKDKCVHQLFEEQAERTPEAVAVVFESQRLTYRQLNERANQLAHHLRNLGVVPETLVGICVERSLEMVVGLLGILKAGGAYVPLDPAYPKERLSFMLKDAMPKVLLIQERWIESLPESLAEVVRLDADWPAISGLPVINPQSQATARNLAYVIYTSGSTGQPKGVLLEHCGLCNLVQAQIQAFEIRSDSRVLQFASLCFDASASEIFTALVAGATLVTAAKESLMPGPDLLRLLQEQAVSVVTLPPSVLAVLPEHQLAGLRTVVSAGEACPAEIVNRWAPGRRFINAYGPTEATVCASLTVCQGGPTRPAIGRPIANTRIYLLDRQLQPVPIGVPGELYIGGVGLARGYHNRPGLTAEKFIPDPFGREPGAKLYKTGDLARYLTDGQIDYLGRLDHQVKLRGFRVELEEIEAQLGQHPAVQSVVVLAREDVPGDQRLVAYLTSKNGEPPPVSELRAWLQSRLPDYMIPSAFVRLEEWPLTPNGKVDRKALPPPQDSGHSSGSHCVLPRNELERSIASVWQEVLRLEKISMDASFFNLGGHSLLLVQVHGKLGQMFGEGSVSMMDLFKYPTISSLAKRLSEKGKAETSPAEHQAQAQKTQAGKNRLNRRLKLNQGPEDPVPVRGNQIIQ